MKDSNSQIINKNSKKEIDKSFNNNFVLEENQSMNNNLNIDINYCKIQTNKLFQSIRVMC